jgi:hypothetical protein
VSTTDPDPGYLRFTSLDEFDGSSWRPSVRDIPPSQRVTSGLSASTGPVLRVRTQRVSYNISISNAFIRLAPGAVPTKRRQRVRRLALQRGELRHPERQPDLTTSRPEVLPRCCTWSNRRPTSCQRGSAAAKLPSTSRAAQRSAAGGLQTGLLGRGRRTHRLPARGSDPGTGSEWRWVQVQHRDRCPAAARRPRQVPDHRPVGYCEQFASAMALMARSLNIPARVAVGFLHRSASQAAAMSTARTTCTRGPSCTSTGSAGSASSPRRRS